MESYQPLQPIDLVGQCPAIETLRADIATAARSDAKVLILGETGVGKELVAQLIHLEGLRKGKPFVPVNCSGIPETLLASELFGHVRGSFTGAYRDNVGLVRRANGGTLFLDELGEMSLSMQAMLLRFAETGEVQPVGSDRVAGTTNVRLIMATNRDLRAAVRAGTFREDLYYRLSVIEIQVPPLRSRGTDVLLLFRYYGEVASRAHGLRVPELTPAAEEALLRYQWPGNVRQLRNAVERLVLADHQRPVTPADFPSEITAEGAGKAPVRTAAHAGISDDVSDRSRDAGGEAVDAIWNRLLAGEDFWSVVHQPFRAHEITSHDVAEIVSRGLRQTDGSYRLLVRLFNMPDSDYKRFHGFLYQHRCNVPIQNYRPRFRMARARAGAEGVVPVNSRRWRSTER